MTKEVNISAFKNVNYNEKAINKIWFMSTDTGVITMLSYLTLAMAPSPSQPCTIFQAAVYRRYIVTITIATRPLTL